uniref:Uncharacterized protein n=1 Tax=Arundo donax TaxID=35708 RepID=A0A0A9H1R4_ARUDO
MGVRPIPSPNLFRKQLTDYGSVLISPHDFNHLGRSMAQRTTTGSRALTSW